MTNLLEFDSKSTTAFVSKLVSYLDQCCATTPPHQMLESGDEELRRLIPVVTQEDPASTSVDHLVLPFGLSLLYEIAFNLNVYTCADVVSPSLQSALMQEFREILHSLITSKKIFQELNTKNITEAQLL